MALKDCDAPTPDIPETVQEVILLTSDCFLCGMVEDAAELDIKICGDKDCCFSAHLDNRLFQKSIYKRHICL